MNVTLIGMAGSGKSYIGKRLAQRNKMEFVDTDDVMEQKYGKKIQSLLDELGAERYLDLEGEVVISVSSGRDNLVLAPGGSIIYRPATLAHTRAISRVVYLHVPFEIVEARLVATGPRAIIGLGDKSLRQLYDERMPIYEKSADFVVDAMLDVEDVIRTIIAIAASPGLDRGDALDKKPPPAIL